jgi:hypothetical protein
MVYANISTLILNCVVDNAVVLLTYLSNGVGGHCDAAMNSKGI